MSPSDLPLHTKEDAINIGVRIPEWATHALPIFQGILSYLRDNNLKWHLHSALHSGDELRPDYIDQQWTGDGLIVFRPQKMEAEAWKKAGIPLVNVSAESVGISPISILPDNRQMGEIAADHFIERGLHQFAYLGNAYRHYSQERMQGFKQRLAEHGHPLKVINLPPYLTKKKNERWRHIQNSLLRTLKNLPTPIGVLARDDILAISILNAANELNIQVPHEMAVIGLGNSFPHCQLAWPPLTSVSYPAKMLGYKAAHALHQTFKGLPVNSPILCPSSGILERESTKIIHTDDELIAKAAMFIHQYAGQTNINVSELSKKIGLSYSSFRQRFRKAMGQSAKEAIIQIRVAKAKEFLLESQINIQEISYQMEFSSPEDFSRFFTTHCGISPSKYRKKHL